MRKFTDKELLDMTKEEACNEISNEVYEASRLIETMECCRKVQANGHVLRQKIAQFASDLMDSRWVE